MSYGLPEQPRRRGGIGKLIFPAILFFGAMMFFRSMSAPPAQQPAPNDQAGQGVLYSPERSGPDEYRIKEGLFEPKGQSDEYKIKEGLFEPKKQPMPSSQSQGTVQSNSAGKWSMEDVDGNGSTPAPVSKKTEEGQWSLEEVEDTPTKQKQRFKFSNQ